MKVLAFSDVIKWECYEEIVDKIQPDIIALAGDLTSDGFANFWRYRNSENFLNIRKTHVNKFYRFLRYAGKKSVKNFPSYRKKV
jgi:Icc-related predicted phosphoesterase